jgi:VanZ family protein
MKKIDIPAPPWLRALCLLAAAAMVAQLFVLAQPQFAGAIVRVFWDKTVHFVYFGVMAFFLWIAAEKRWTVAVWATVLLIGALDELRQAGEPGRFSDINDFLANGFGAAAALIVGKRIKSGG